MASTYTTNNGIEKIGDGEQSGTWGDTTNTNFDLLDEALDGQVSILLSATGTSGSPNTVVITDGASSNGRNRFVRFYDGGDIGGTVYVQLTPNDAEKIMFVQNALSGSRSILLFQGTYNASNDYELVAGRTTVVRFDGGGASAVCSEVAIAPTGLTDASSVTITGGSITGTTITLNNAAGVAPTTDGEIKFDRTGENLEVGDGSGTKIFSHDTGTATLQNKTIDSANNTLTLDLSEGTLTGTTAQFNTALSDGSFTTLAGSETLTNKTLTTPTLVLANAAGAAPTTDGEIKFDRTGENLEVGDGSTTKIFSHDGGTATLTGKTINSASNTITVNLSTATLTGTTAQFNTALSDGSFVTLAGSETLTNKSLTAPTLTGTVLVSDEIAHTGDTNNKVAYGTDTQDYQTGGASRLDISDSGVRLGGANARVTTILDEDTMSSNSATALATQQSIKAYVDALSIGILTDTQTFTSSGTWTRPSVTNSATALVKIQVIGAGGSGAWEVGTNARSTGGGGGTYEEVVFPYSVFNATETVTVGAGGAARVSPSLSGIDGGDTHITVGGTFRIGVLGSLGGTRSTTAGVNVVGGDVAESWRGLYVGSGQLALPDSLLGDGGSSSGGRQNGIFGGAGRATGDWTTTAIENGGNSIFGGGGGGSARAEGTDSASNGGTSIFAGNGGNASVVNGVSATNGAYPGGGGGAMCAPSGSSGASGAGADGWIRVTVWEI